MSLLNVSFKERSTWASLLIILLVFTGYFSQVYDGLISGTLDKAEVTALFIGAVAMVIIMEIVLHIAIAIFDAKAANEVGDERERLFSIKAGNISGWVLGIAVLTIAIQTFLLELDQLWIANLLLFAVFVSQVASYSLQIFYYRRGY